MTTRPEAAAARGRTPALRLGALLLALTALAACSDGAEPRAAPSSPAPPTASAGPAQPEPARNAIPAAFLGAWDLRPADCREGGGDGRLVIGAGGLRFYESEGRVDSARVEGDTLTVTASMTGEGETWTETYRFQLMPGGGELIQRVSPGDDGLRRVRCGVAP